MDQRARDDLVVAIDVGGTGLKGALIDSRGRVVIAERRPTDRERGADVVIETILAFARDLRRGMVDAPAAGRVVAVGVVVPGIVDEDAGVAHMSVNLGWRDVPLRRLLEERLGLPTVVGHDVRAAGRAEGLLGAARGCDHYLFVTLGTGVGAAVVVDGAPYAGAHGMGGEFGHMTVQQDGPLCDCGRRGCIEALASATAVARRYQALAREKVSAHDVARRAAAGDAVAALVWADAVAALSTGIANYVALLDPQRVVIGGGMASAGAILFRPLVERLASEALLQSAPPVVPAGLGEAAGYLGAGLMAWRQLGVPLDAFP